MSNKNNKAQPVEFRDIEPSIEETLSPMVLHGDGVNDVFYECVLTQLQSTVGGIAYRDRFLAQMLPSFVSKNVVAWPARQALTFSDGGSGISCYFLTEIFACTLSDFIAITISAKVQL